MDDAERLARAQSFGSVAEAYDRHRPGYPDALLDDVLALAGPSPRVLEVGAGTGIATRALAARGARVTAVEPDAQMAQVTRQRTAGLPVDVHVEAFEEHEAEEGAYDLVVAAQSWHWVDARRAGLVAARALRRQGHLAAWWNVAGALEGPVWEAILEAYRAHAPELGFSTTRHAARPDLEQVHPPPPGFGTWTTTAYAWQARYSAAGYAALVGTHSDHLLLAPGARTSLLRGIEAAIDAHGGALDYPYRTALLTAPRT